MIGYSHILVAADLAADQETILPRATDLARAFGSKLTLLHVVDEREAGGELQMPIDGELFEPGSPLPRGAIPEAGGVEYGGHRLERSAHAFLDDLARDCGVADVATEVVASSAVARSIVQIANERAVDLIVVGGRTHTGLGWLFGSTTDAVVRRAPCDVLVVHEQWQGIARGGSE
jgi:universal stress protein A